MITLKQYFISIFILTILIIGLFGVETSDAKTSFFHNREPLNDNKIKEIISLFRGKGFLNKEYGLFYGYEYSNHSKFIAYEVYHFPGESLKTFDKVIRLDGLRYTVLRKQIKGFKCDFKTSLECDLKEINYVSLKPSGPLIINKDTIGDFIKLEHDIEDESLANLLSILRNPLSQIIDKDIKQNKNSNEIFVEKNIILLLDMKELVNYLIISIDLVRTESGKREYLARYCKEEDRYCQTPIHLYISKSSVNNFKYHITVKMGPIT